MATIYTHATIITIDPEKTVFIDGALLVTSQRITAIGKTSDLLKDLPSDTKTIDCSGRIIIPGLVNTHAHLAQSLLRGLAEDLPLHSWLCDAVWPLEANYGPTDGYVAARLTIAEMLKSGTTCFLEAMLTYRSGFENVAKAVDEMGIRGCLGKLVKVEETNSKLGMTDPRDRDIFSMSIDSVVKAHEQYHGASDGRIHVWMAAGTPRGSPASAHKAIGDACAEHGMGLTMHCAEAPKDLDIYRENYDCSPVEFCLSNNLIGHGRRTVLAHMVNLDLPKDAILLGRHNVEASVAHNPASNCKLGSGIAPIPELLEQGVKVSLGTDGAPCNNTYDMFQEMRLAGLIHKGNKRNAAIVGAQEVLEMATINGARALGLDKDIGSLQVGKLADFVVIDTGKMHCGPFDPAQIAQGGLDPVTTVVYSCTGADVDMVVVDGKLLVQGGRLRCNENEIVINARHAVKEIRERSGVSARRMCNWR